MANFFLLAGEHCQFWYRKDIQTLMRKELKKPVDGLNKVVSGIHSRKLFSLNLAQIAAMADKTQGHLRKMNQVQQKIFDRKKMTLSNAQRDICQKDLNEQKKLFKDMDSKGLLKNISQF